MYFIYVQFSGSSRLARESVSVGKGRLNQRADMSKILDSFKGHLLAEVFF